MRCSSAATRRLLLAVALLPTTSLSAQSNDRINIYRFILDVDVPESASLIALGLGIRSALRGAAPKPVAASIVFSRAPEDSALRTVVALDAAPYFLFGGGGRSLS